MLKPSVAANAIPLGSDPNVRWPGAVVPYIITGTFSKFLNVFVILNRFKILMFLFLAAAEKTIILQAMQQYTDNTCVRFIPRTTQANFITIDNSDTGCWSYVGRSLDNTYNHVNLQNPSCMTTGTVAHELMHAIGFYHEFTRPDRDDWVSIDTGALLTQYQTSRS